VYHKFDNCVHATEMAMHIYWQIFLHSVCCILTNVTIPWYIASESI